MAFYSLLMQHFFGFMRGRILAGPVGSGFLMLIETTDISGFFFVGLKSALLNHLHLTNFPPDRGGKFLNRPWQISFIPGGFGVLAARAGIDPNADGRGGLPLVEFYLASLFCSWQPGVIGQATSPDSGAFFSLAGRKVCFLGLPPLTMIFILSRLSGVTLDGPAASEEGSTSTGGVSLRSVKFKFLFIPELLLERNGSCA